MTQLNVASPFRKPALLRAGDHRYGTVVLSRAVGHGVLTILFASITGLVVVFFACLSVTRKTHVTGVLLPTQGLIRIQSMQAGVITEVRVREGQAVHAGDVLFVVTSERSSATQGEAERAVSKLLQARRDSIDAERSEQHLQLMQRLDALRRRAEDLRAESGRIDQQIALQRRRVALAVDSANRQSELHAAKFVSVASVQDRQADLLDQQQRLSELQRAKGAIARDLAAAQADLRDQQLQGQRDQEVAARSVAAIEQDLAENEARRQALVRAPHDGNITSIAVTAGAAISSGQMLASVLPAGSALEAELYATSRAAGFIKPGMPVLLRYQAYPYQKFGQSLGQVREVTGSAMQANELALPVMAQSGAGTEPIYRVRVHLDSQTVRAYGREEPLKPGMAVEASVLLEHRRLYEWVLEPLYTIEGRV